MKGQKQSNIDKLQKGMGELAQIIQAQDEAIRFLLSRVKEIDETLMPKEDEVEEPKKFEV